MQFDAHQPYYVHVRASTQAHFETAMSLAFNGKHVTGYGDYGDFGLVFFWFKSTIGMFEPTILKSKNDKGEYVLHYSNEYHHFARDNCVGDVLEFSWNWVCKHPHTEKGEFGFDLTTDPGDNGNDIMCIIRRTYMEYHYE